MPRPQSRFGLSVARTLLLDQAPRRECTHLPLVQRRQLPTAHAPRRQQALAHEEADT